MVWYSSCEEQEEATLKEIESNDPTIEETRIYLIFIGKNLFQKSQKSKKKRIFFQKNRSIQAAFVPS